MSNYIKHLEQLSSRETYRRKKEYIRYNLKEFLPNKPNSRTSVLEVGPGLGELVSFLNDQGITNIDLIDNDRNILRYISLKYKVKGIKYIKDFRKIEKKIDNYDLIILIQVLEHLPINILKQTLKVLFAHLKKNGYLIIVVPNANNPLGLTERYADLQHTISFTEQSLLDLVNISNIKNYVISIRGYDIPPEGIINFTRMILQKILHKIMLVVMIINGGVFFKTMTPNIMMVLKKN